MNFLELIIKNKLSLSLIILIIILFSGIRFSDISILYDISINFNNFEDRKNDFYGMSANYIYDSPFKIFLINFLPSNIFIISLFFLFISFLPFIFFTKFFNNIILNESLILIFLISPLLKINFLNIGTGDGFLISLIFLMFYLNDHRMKYIILISMALWHPHQSFFIFISYFIGLYCYDKFDINFFIKSSATMFIGAIIFLAYQKIYLGNIGASRYDILTDNFIEIFSRNTQKNIFLFFAISIFYFYLLFYQKVNLKFIFSCCWLIICLIVSLIQLDVTRVFFIITLPFYIFFIKNFILSNNKLLNKKSFYLLIFLNIIVPTVSWSGVDYMLYYDLKNDICKYLDYFC